MIFYQFCSCWLVLKSIWDWNGLSWRQGAPNATMPDLPTFQTPKGLPNLWPPSQRDTLTTLRTKPMFLWYCTISICGTLWMSFFLFWFYLNIFAEFWDWLVQWFNEIELVLRLWICQYSKLNIAFIVVPLSSSIGREYLEVLNLEHLQPNYIAWASAQKLCIFPWWRTELNRSKGPI